MLTKRPGVAGVSISAIDPKNSTEEFNKVAGKAALFTTDSDAPQSNRVVYIGTDNVAAGRQAGEEIKKALPSSGKVMMFAGLNGRFCQPINPASHNVPKPTGIKARITAVRLRKWINTMIAMAISEYHAAVI